MSANKNLRMVVLLTSDDRYQLTRTIMDVTNDGVFRIPLTINNVPVYGENRTCTAKMYKMTNKGKTLFYKEQTE